MHYFAILHKNAINSINTVEKVHHHSAKAASHNENAKKKLPATKNEDLHQHTRINPLSNFVFAFKMDFFIIRNFFVFQQNEFSTFLLVFGSKRIAKEKKFE